MLGRGEGGESRGAWRGGRVVRGWQVVESEGIAFPCGLGDDPHPVRLGADPLWLCLSPPPENRPFPPSSSPSVISSSPPTQLHSPLHTYTHSLVSAAPSCEVPMSGQIRPPGDLRPWETSQGAVLAESLARGENGQGSEVKRPAGSRVPWTGWSVRASHHLSRKNLRARSMFMRWPTLVTPKST